MAAAHVLHYGVGVPVRKVPAVLRALTGVELSQGIRHGTVAEMIGHLSSQPLGLGGKVRRLSSLVCLPELHRFSEQTAQTIAEAATSSSLGLDHLADRAQHVGQAFLLLHPRQSLSIVAPSSIRYHHPSIVRGHHLTYLFVAVTSTNLVHRSLIRFERHQKSRPAVHSPIHHQKKSNKKATVLKVKRND